MAALLGSLWLGAADYGHYMLLASTAALCAGVGQLGVQSVVTRDMARACGAERADRSSTSVLLICAVTGLVSTGFVVLVHAGLALPQVLIAESHRLWLLVPWSVSIAINNQSVAILMGVHDFPRASWLAASRGLLIGILVSAAAISGGVLLTVAVTVVAECCIAGASLLVLSKARLLALRVSRQYLNRLVRIGMGAGVASILIQIVSWCAQTYLAAQDGGLVELGVFSLGSRLGLLASLIASTIVSTLLPFMSRNRGAIGYRLGVLAPTAISLAFGTVAIAAMLLLIPLWPSEYGERVGVLIVMVLVAIASVMNVSVGSMAVARGSIRLWVWSDVLLAAILGSLGLLLITSWGALGLSVSHLSAFVGSSVFLITGMELGRTRERL